MHGADGAAKSHARRGPSLCPAGEHGSSRICKGTTSHVTSSRIARRWSAGQDSSDSEEAGGTVVTVVVSRPHGVLTCRRQGHRLTGRVVVACSAGPRPPPPVVPSTLRRARRQAGRLPTAQRIVARATREAVNKCTTVAASTVLVCKGWLQRVWLAAQYSYVFFLLVFRCLVA